MTHMRSRTHQATTVAALCYAQAHAIPQTQTYINRNEVKMI